MKLPLLIAFLLCTLAINLTIANDDNFKCSACRHFVASLEEKLDNETPRNHIDARNRLTADGERYGKVVAWKVSEIRAVEIIEDLCSDSFTDGKFLTADNTWVTKRPSTKYDDDDAKDEAKARLKMGRKMLADFCGSILEQFEEELVDAALKAEDTNIDVVGELLCVKLGKYCSAFREEEGDGGNKDEL
jgi:hypothetical protein